MSTHRGRGFTAVDPVVVLGDKLAELNRLWRKIDEDRERIEATLPTDDPARTISTSVLVGDRRCSSSQEIRRRAAAEGVDPTPLVGAWHASVERCRAARSLLGLEKLDRAEAMAKTGYLEIRQQIARTRAISPEGIAVKLSMVTEGLRDGLCGDELALAESALEDLAVNGSKFVRVA